MYVMTADYGAASQLEKIDMLDFADFVVLNKFEKRGAEDALRDVRKQVARNRKLFKTPPEELPVYPTIASQFNDAGVNTLFVALCARLHEQQGRLRPWKPQDVDPLGPPKRQAIIPGSRVRYLAEIAAGGRTAKRRAIEAAAAASRAHGFYRTLESLEGTALPAPLERYGDAALAAGGWPANAPGQYSSALDAIRAEGVAVAEWPKRRRRLRPTGSAIACGIAKCADRTTSRFRTSSCQVATPSFDDWGARLSFLMTENLRAYPYTGGIYPYRREDGPDACSRAGMPERTNQRFHYLADTRRRGCRPRSTRRRSTARTRTSGRTYTAASATPASPSPRSTT